MCVCPCVTILPIAGFLLAPAEGWGALRMLTEGISLQVVTSQWTWKGSKGTQQGRLRSLWSPTDYDNVKDAGSALGTRRFPQQGPKGPGGPKGPPALRRS